jgi:sulfur carrier protein
VTVLLNGAPHEVEDGTTLAALVAASAPRRLVAHTAAARNGEVVPRSAWPLTPLAEGDRIELLTAAQGG